MFWSSSLRLSFSEWYKAGILSIGHLLDNVNLLSYKDLQKRYIFRHGDFYK